MYVFDIDGTLSDASHRVHLIIDYAGKKIHSPNWDKFLDAAKDDPPIPSMVTLITNLYEIGYEIILSTGRRENQRKMTIKWLNKHKIKFDLLIMRPIGDSRSDTIVKPAELAKIFGPHPFSDIITIFEDRKRVTTAWRKLGYHVCQVAEGDY